MSTDVQSAATVRDPLTMAVSAHLEELAPALASLGRERDRLASWGAQIARRLWAGSRLLVAGNGGSAAEAQHLSAEIVGRYRDERQAFSAIALHTDTSALTAIGNDYGYENVFSRQIAAHGRAGDILLLLTTSGRSENLLRAASEARRRRVACWAMTGGLPNPLASLADDCLPLSGTGASVQEAQLVAIHAICACFDLEIQRLEASGGHLK